MNDFKSQTCGSDGKTFWFPQKTGQPIFHQRSEAVLRVTHSSPVGDGGRVEDEEHIYRRPVKANRCPAALSMEFKTAPCRWHVERAPQWHTQLIIF